MRVTQKGQVTIPLPVRRALGIHPGSDVEFELDERGARRLVDLVRGAARVDRRHMRGAGEGELMGEGILALTRR